MSSFVADPAEGPLSSDHASAPGPYAATSANVLNLQPSFVGEATDNDPSDIKACPTYIKTESDNNHGISNPIFF